VSLCSLSVLRDRSVSLQDRQTLISKIAAILGCVLGAVTAMVLCAMLCQDLATYTTPGAPTLLLAGDTLFFCPSLRSFFLVNCAMLVAVVFLSAVFQILATAWIIFQRAVFLSPPPGVWDDPEEIKALNWICTEYGDVIPTIYMLPPSVHRQHREVNFCMLYSHGNAMDLVSETQRNGCSMHCHVNPMLTCSFFCFLLPPPVPRRPTPCTLSAHWPRPSIAR
jgi:hypothetical protein